MEFDLKWVHMARYELILNQVRAIRLRIISQRLRTPKQQWKEKEKIKNNWKIKILPIKETRSHCKLGVF